MSAPDNLTLVRPVGENAGPGIPADRLREVPALIDTAAGRPTVAVCLAAWNGLRWLPQQLESILGQSGVDVTVVVSVDRSTDGTEAWVDQRAARDPRVIVLRHGMQFGGAARNFFRLLTEVDFSRFDYVSLADQDDVWYATKLSRAVASLREQGAQGYSSDVTAFWPSGRTLHVRKSQPQRRWDYLFEAAGPGCTYVMTSAAVQELQDLLRTNWEALQEVALHDWFIYAFARTKGYRWLIDDRPGLLYRQHGSNQVGVNTGGRAFWHRMGKVLSGWAIEQARLTARVLGVEDDPFVRRSLRSGRAGLLRLALHCGACRRRPRDRAFFFLSCMLLFLRETLRCRHR